MFFLRSWWSPWDRVVSPHFFAGFAVFSGAHGIAMKIIMMLVAPPRWDRRCRFDRGRCGPASIGAARSQIGVQAAGHDFVDLAEGQGCLHAAGDAFDAGGAAAGNFGADLFHRGFRGVGGETDGVREAGVQHQKFGDAVGTQIRGVGFAISFESGAGAQQADPFQRLRLGAFAVKLAEMHAQQRGERGGAFQRSAGLNELPAFAVGHGRIGDALKKMRAVLDGVAENRRRPRLRRRRRAAPR